MFSVKKTFSFRLLSFKLPQDIVQIIFDFWIGFVENDDCAFNVTRYEFIEGIHWFFRNKAGHTLILNQMLYGSALIPNIRLSLFILDQGATDIETAISLALEHGYITYIRAILYLKDPHVPLPLGRWMHYLKKQ